MDTSQGQKASGLTRKERKIQRLLEIVEKSQEQPKKRPIGRPRNKAPKPKIDHTHMSRFIRAYNLETGLLKVDTHILAFLYFKDWSRHKDARYSYTEFFRKLAKRFKTGRYNRRRYYLLNMDVSNELKEKAKAYKEEMRKKSREEKAKRVKRQRAAAKVSIPKQA